MLNRGVQISEVGWHGVWGSPQGHVLAVGMLINEAGSAVTHRLPAGLCLPVETEKKGGNCRGNLSWIASPCRAVPRCSHSSQTSCRKRIRVGDAGQRSVGCLLALPNPRRAPGWLGHAGGAALADLGHCAVLEMHKWQRVCSVWHWLFGMNSPQSQAVFADHPRMWWIIAESCGPLGYLLRGF